VEDGEKKTSTWSGGCHGRGEEERDLLIGEQYAATKSGGQALMGEQVAATKSM
jgi:hypothetical protein